MSYYGEPLDSKSDLYNRDSVDLLARLIYGEARGEITSAKVGVAYVVSNRKAHSRFPNTVRDVILEDNAFEVMSEGNVNFDDVLKPSLGSAAWKKCLDIAQNLSNYSNPMGDKLFFVGKDYWDKHTKNENGKLYYDMGPGSGWQQVTKKILVGNLMFFIIVGY